MVSHHSLALRTRTNFQFDPSRAQNHAPVDLADDGHNTVEPFYTPGVASTAQSPQMSQYPQSAATTSDGYGAQTLSRGPSSATSAGYAGLGAFGTMQMPEPVPALPPSATGAAAATAGMSAKQREAYQERVNRAGGSGSGPSYGNGPYGPSSSSSEPRSPDVTVAEDAGAYDEHDSNAGPDTIPPT